MGAVVSPIPSNPSTVVSYPVLESVSSGVSLSLLSSGDESTVPFGTVDLECLSLFCQAVTACKKLYRSEVVTC